MSGIAYRPEIDGLRTIAVFSVILYHAELLIANSPILRGGYLGVDIFFVISGFLITRIIYKEIADNGNFSFSNFYERRARRILPQLFLVTIACFPFAHSLLLPAQYIDFAKSAISIAGFSSNFYWLYSLQEYGAESSALKPLLHTWSLAIEEQYYFLFPIIVLALSKWLKNNSIAILTLIMLLSLAMAEYFSGKNPSFSFYILITRFWELLIGSILAYAIHIHPPEDNDSLLKKTMPSLGLFLIIHSVLFMDFDTIRHPGYATLLPITGTVLIIWFSNEGEFVTRILSSKILVFFGLISYSLYLWHYPIFSFARMTYDFSSGTVKLLATLLCVALSYVSYKLIETPFRKKITRRLLYPFLAACFIVIVGLSLSVINQDGYPSRFEGTIADGADEMVAYRSKYWGANSRYTKISDFSKDRFSVEVIGNSWAQDIANAILENSEYEVGFRGMTGHMCKAITLFGFHHKPYDKTKEDTVARCKRNKERFKTRLDNTDLVVIADNRHLSDVKDKDVIDETMANIGLLREYGYKGPVLIIANRPTYKKAIFEIINEYGSNGNGVNLYAERYIAQPLEKYLEEDKEARDTYSTRNVDYYSLVEPLCQAGKCYVALDGKPLYYDGSHLTMSGAQYIGRHLVNKIKSTYID